MLTVTILSKKIIFMAEFSMKVSDILKSKGPEVFTIGEDKLLSEALKVLVKNKIGVLLVLNFSGIISGILSERDILRASYENPYDYLNLPVREFMTLNVIIVEPDDTLDYVERIMTTNKCRHLPVISNKVLIGLVSIGDLIKAELTETRFENKYLKDYISGAI